MTYWLLIPATIFSFAILFFSIVLWGVFPDWFGIYGYKRKSPVGKIIIRLIILYQLLAISCPYIAWSINSDVVASFVILIPVMYILTLWFYRVDKNKRCFITKENNLKYYLQGVDDQLQHFDKLMKNESSLSISFFCLIPEESLIADITTSIEPDFQYVRKFISGGYLVNKVWFLEGFTKPLLSIDDAAIKQQLTQIINTVWDAGGEFGGWSLVSQKRIDDRMELGQD